MTHRRPRHRRGYVLLVALALTALAAVVVVGLSRIAMQRIVTARLAGDELQRKWGTITVRQTLLPHAEALIEQVNRFADGPVSVRTASVQLGSQQFVIRLADEQAKANVNTLLATRDASDASEAVRRLMSGTGTAGRVRLRAAEDNPWPIGSYAQVFDGVPLDELSSGREVPIDRITCWGNGKVNLHRANEDVLEQVLSPYLKRVEIDALVQAANENREQGVSVAISEQFGTVNQPDMEKAAALQEVLTDRSRCHSLWLTIQSDQRQWHSLAVREKLGEDQVRVQTFEW